MKIADFKKNCRAESGKRKCCSDWEFCKCFEILHQGDGPFFFENNEGKKVRNDSLSFYRFGDALSGKSLEYSRIDRVLAMLHFLFGKTTDEIRERAEQSCQNWRLHSDKASDVSEEIQNSNSLFKGTSKTSA